MGEPRRFVVLAGAMLAAVVMAGPLRGEAVDEDESSLRTVFDRQLTELATICDQHGLTDQASWTRRWSSAGTPGSGQVFYVPGEPDPSAPGEMAAPLAQSWYRKFRELRREFAADLYSLALKRVESRPAHAYRLLHEVLWNDPEHGEARRLLGRGPDRREPSVQRAQRAQLELGWRAGSYWTVRSPHFSIVSQLDAVQTREVATKLERLHAVWQQLFFDLWSIPGGLQRAVEGSGRSRLGGRSAAHQVVVYAEREAYLRHLQRVEPRFGNSLSDVVKGYYSAARRTAYLYREDESDESVWLHEATHQLFQESIAAASSVGERSNFWAVEGVAIYMESLDVRTGRAVLGGYASERLQFARYRRLSERFYVPAQRLAALGRTELLSDPRVSALYTQAAGLSHLLMDADGGRYREGFLQLLRAIYRGRDRADSLSQLVDQSWDAIDAAYETFLQGPDPRLTWLINPARIRKLCLTRLPVTDEVTGLFEDCRELEWLDLSHTTVGDVTVRRLAGLQQLEQLNLEGTRITDSSLESLAKLSRLVELDLSGTAIGDKGLEQLARLPRLKILWLTGTRVTDAGLPALSGLKQLEQLELEGTQVTPEALRRLTTQLPNLRKGVSNE